MKTIRHVELEANAYQNYMTASLKGPMPSLADLLGSFFCHVLKQWHMEM